MSYFLHRIQKTGSNTQKGIETHDDLNDAIRSFWGRMKSAYGKSDYTFVSCKITDDYGNTIGPYNMTWLQDPEQENVYFLHHIRKDGENYDKGIDELSSLDAAYGNLAELMEYGYDNPKFPNVTSVHCEITDLLSGGMVLLESVWNKPAEEPAPEPEPEPEAAE